MRLMLDPKIDWAGAMPGSSRKLPLCWLGALGSPMGRGRRGKRNPLWSVVAAFQSLRLWGNGDLPWSPYPEQRCW